MKKFFYLLLVSFISIQAQTQYRLNFNAINLPINNNGTIALVNIPPMEQEEDLEYQLFYLMPVL